MCGRYANHVRQMGEWAEILRDWPRDAASSYNVAPTQPVPVVTAEGGRVMRWGLVPHWSKEASPKYATFNARVESAADKPAYRSAWKQSRTCLIPALGYYEWRGEKGNKQPFFVRSVNEQPIVMAGLWDVWQRPEQDIVSCTILTKSSEGSLVDLHPRMPIMLTPDTAATWLNDGTGRIDLMTGLNITADLQCYPVSKTVNKVANNSDTLTDPVQR
ncbi:MAG: SOS response-associated peptidase [Pseudomonadota bacterium]